MGKGRGAGSCRDRATAAKQPSHLGSEVTDSSALTCKGTQDLSHIPVRRVQIIVSTCAAVEHSDHGVQGSVRVTHGWNVVRDVYKLKAMQTIGAQLPVLFAVAKPDCNLALPLQLGPGHSLRRELG